MNPISSTIIEGVRIFYPTAAEPMPVLDQKIPSFTVRVIEGWHWLYVHHDEEWRQAYEQPFPHSAAIMAAIRYAHPGG